MAKKSKTVKAEKSKESKKSEDISVKQEGVSLTGKCKVLGKYFFKLLKWLLFLVKWLLFLVLFRRFLIYYSFSLDKIFERDLLSACKVEYSCVVGNFHFSSLILSLATIFILIYSFRRFLIKKPLFAERIKNKITRLCCNILMVIFINLLSIMILPSLSYLFFSLVKHTLNISLCTSYRYSSSLMKPIIYLYPTEAMDVSVKLGAPEKLSHTYPKYVEGWDVRVEPNGNLTDMATRRHYYALYWEGKQANLPQYDDGFVVAKNEIAPFLEEKLALLGLNEREANEFIIYWLPKLESAPYTFIHFVSREEQNKYMPLEVQPTADTVIRVLMAFKSLDKPIEVKEQVLLPTPARTGFTVIEWGGTEIGSGYVY